MPRISVILPAYNAEALLYRCVRSVLAQSFKDFELIIVDDGSSDRTPELCDGFAALDSRVRILHQQNAGVSEARNAGIAAAAGGFIAFLDADDYLEPDAFDTMLGAIDDSGADCCICGYYNLYPSGERHAVGAPLPSGLYSPAETQKAIVLPLLSDRLCISPFLGTVWRYLFSAKTIAERGIRFSGAYLEDEIFLIEYFSLPHVLTCVDRPLYNYFQNPGSVTRRYLEGFVETFLGSLDGKSRLVDEFSIPVPSSWRENSAWAGLLIAVSNEFAPGNTRGFSQKISEIKKICREPVFETALRRYVPSDMARNKAVVAALLRRGMYLPLALLYTIKNRNRG